MACLLFTRGPGGPRVCGARDRHENSNNEDPVDHTSRLIELLKLSAFHLERPSEPMPPELITDILFETNRRAVRQVCDATIQRAREPQAEDSQDQGQDDGCIDAAWGVIANASDWDMRERHEWRKAAELWRDRYMRSSMGSDDVVGAVSTTDPGDSV